MSSRGTSTSVNLPVGRALLRSILSGTNSAGFADRFASPVSVRGAEAERCYFFTATPKYSNVIGKAGMNDTEVYGSIIAKVPAPQLVQNGYIIPPKVIATQMRLSVKGEDIAQRDCEYLL